MTLTPPVLSARPRNAPCVVDGMKSACTVLITEDWHVVLRWMTAACLVMGGTLTECAAD